MIVQAELQRIFKNLDSSLQAGFNAFPDVFAQQSMMATSSTSANIYFYLSSLPGVREWIGERVLNDIATRAMTVPNREWEWSLAMRESEIEDSLGSADGGKLNAWAIAARAAGELYRIHRNELYTATLRAGLTETWAPDGQYFYDSDHPRNPSAPGVNTWSNRFDTAGANARTLTHANADYVYTAFNQIPDEQGRPMVLGDIVAEVPRALETTAKQIWTDSMVIPSTSLGANAANLLQPNPNQGRVKAIIVNPFLDGYSTTRWYLHCVGRVIKPFVWQDRKAIRERTFDGNNSEVTAVDGRVKYYTDARYACARLLPHLSVTADV